MQQGAKAFDREMFPTFELQATTGDAEMKRASSFIAALACAFLPACSAVQTSSTFGPTQTQPTGAMPHIAQGGGAQWASIYYRGCAESLIEGPLNSVWFGDPCNGRTLRLDMGLHLTRFPVANSAIAEGPDGNVWGVILSSSDVSRLTPAGVVTYFHVPCITQKYAFLWQINSGADGNMWVTVRNQATIVRVTMAGVVTCVTISRPGSDFVTAGPDGNTWFTEQEAPSLLGKITPSGTLTEYSDPNFCGSLIGAGDGYLYCGSPHGIVRISTADAGETVVAPQRGEIWGFSTSGKGSNAQLYFSAPDTHLVTLHLSSLNDHIDVLPLGQSGPRYVAFGPDGNLWYYARIPGYIVIGVDIFRILIVNPASMSLSVGQTQTATASQKKNPNNVFSATSADPSIATVATGPTPGTFNITGQSTGYTYVRIADSTHNFFDVVVSVH